MSLWKRLFGKKESGEGAGLEVPAAGPSGNTRASLLENPAAPRDGAPPPPDAPGTSSGPWRTRPIFISSTFRDMQSERDHLRNHVFPRLEEELRKRRHHLEPIDLRQGVDAPDLPSEEARELLVLKVCLDEIKRSRPYLIVLLGDRYGWVPPEDRMAAAAEEAGFETDLTGKSVTALEVEFGVLKQDPEQQRRSYFFFREPLPYPDMPPAIAAEYSDEYAPNPSVRANHAKLIALRDRITRDTELGLRVFRYAAGWDSETRSVTGLDAWGDQVFDLLWRDLDEETREFAARPAPTWEEAERDALDEFVEHRTRNFVGREGTMRALLDIARSPSTPGAPWGACVTGAPGSGKSALFAHLFHTLRQDPSLLLLANAAGASPRGASVDAMLRRWIGELAGFLRVPDPLPEKATPDEVDDHFVSLLHRASESRRVVVLLDALNQFEPNVRARHLTWLKAKAWPANARIVATSLPGPEEEALSQWAGIEEIDLPPLTARDAEAVARGIYAQYHRQFNSEAFAVLAAKTLGDGSPAAGNPLWLTLALEQLNLLDADDFARADRDFTGTAAKRLRALTLDVARQLPPDVEGVFDWMLAITEKVHGAGWTRAMAAAVALSRFGWRESDLLTLVPKLAPMLGDGRPGSAFDSLRLASLRRAFRGQLVKRRTWEQLDFFHLQMRQAVLRRCLGDDLLVRKIYGALADYLLELPGDDPLRQEETMHHLIGADDRPRAARYHAGLPGPSPALAASTRTLADRLLAAEADGSEEALDWTISLLEQADLVPEITSTLCNRFQFDLNDAVETVSRLGTRLRLLEAVQSTNQRLSAADPSNAGWLRDLWVFCWRIAAIHESEGDASARQWWQRAYDILSDMKRHGLFISQQDEQDLAQLRRKLEI